MPADCQQIAAQLGSWKVPCIGTTTLTSFKPTWFIHEIHECFKFKLTSKGRVFHRKLVSHGRLICCGKTGRKYQLKYTCLRIDLSSSFRSSVSSFVFILLNNLHLPLWHNDSRISSSVKLTRSFQSHPNAVSFTSISLVGYMPVYFRFQWSPLSGNNNSKCTTF